VPGELTLAHKGVLFLDELGEFPPYLLDALRQPVEEGWAHVARKGIAVSFPCDVQMVAATNPCPCGYAGDRLVACTCSPAGAARYRRRFSGPLLDRFDLQVVVPRLDPADLGGPEGEPSAAVRERVGAARLPQVRRGPLNRSLSRHDLDLLAWHPSAVALLRAAADRLALTARGWDRVRRVARTLADLAGGETVGEAQVAEALSLRVSA
jgi:magnesium chelatase family protein